jgi:hypothetical protein
MVQVIPSDHYPSHQYFCLKSITPKHIQSTTMSDELKKGDEVSWNWGSGQPCKFDAKSLRIENELTLDSWNGSRSQGW